MAATAPPGPRATDPKPSPSTGMQFALPARPNVSHGGSSIPSEPPTRAPTRGRRRTKSTTELLSAIEDLRAQGKALETELIERRSRLETECYAALGGALFARREDDEVAAVYLSITSAAGARTMRKLEELAKLTDIKG